MVSFQPGYQSACHKPRPPSGSFTVKPAGESLPVDAIVGMLSAAGEVRLWAKLYCLTDHWLPRLSHAIRHTQGYQAAYVVSLEPSDAEPEVRSVVH